MDLSALLGVPLNNVRPNAYQLLGLDVGEADQDRILLALQTVTRRLKANRQTVDVALWEKAARAVTQAKEILTDPARKAAYDAKLLVPTGSVTASSNHGSTCELDPAFVSLLPSQNPYEPFSLTRYSLWAQEHAGEFDEEDDFDPSRVYGTPLGDSSIVSSNASVDRHVAPVEAAAMEERPQIRVPKKRRKRGLPLAGILVTLLVLGMLGGVFYSIHLLTQRAAVKQVARAETEDSAPVPVTAAAPTKNVPDPIMGNLRVSERPSGNRRRDDGKNRAVANSPLPSFDESTMAENSVPSSTNVEVPEMASAPLSPPMITATVPPTTAAEPTPEQVAQGEQAIRSLRQAIREQRLKTTDAVFKAAAEKAVTEEQRQVVASWERLVAFGREYDRSIREAATGLKGAETFTVANSPVAHVETKGETIILRVQGRNKEFKLSELVPVYADALAQLKLDKTHPTTIAYRAAYRALSKSPNAHKDALAEHDRLAADPQASLEVNLNGIKERIDELFQD